METNKYGDFSARMTLCLARVLMTTPEYILEGTGSEQAVTRLGEHEHALLHTFRQLEPRDQLRLLANARTYLDDVVVEEQPAMHPSRPRLTHR